MNQRLALAEAFLSEGGMISLDTAVGLMADGIDIKTIEDRIDGFSITNIDEVESYDYE